MSLWNVIGKHTSFITVKVHKKSKQRPGFFQAFMGATPHHPLLKRYLDMFVQYYKGEIKLETNLLEESRQMLGVRILAEAFLAIQEEQRTTESLRLAGVGAERSAQLQQTKSLGNVELWQEVLYSPQMFPNVPPPTSDAEKSCMYVVVSNFGRSPPVIPFYSRVQGSRMCP
jgi:hypothetical protein